MTDLTPQFRVVPAAYVFLRRGDKVLLQLRQGTGYLDGHWAAGAAGHIEVGESVFTAACREAAEELGITIEVADLVGLTSMHRTQADHQPVDERVDWFFECRRWVGEPTITEAAKCAALQWFPLRDLPHPMAPHELFVLERLRADTLLPVVSYGFPVGEVGHGP